MGICASCLGLNRHPSQDVDETDPLLNDEQGQYGGLDGRDVSQPDEEELRREREELEQITTEATESMVDVSRPGDLFAHASGQRSTSGNSTAQSTAEGEGEDDEAAWLRSVQAAGVDSSPNVESLKAGSLVLNIGQLRAQPPSSTPRKSLKGKLPA